MISLTTKYHKTLAEYFSQLPLYLDELTNQSPNIRKLVEQPWQQIKAQLWNEVTYTLCDPEFVRIKCDAGLERDLEQDCSNALDNGCLSIRYLPPCPINGSYQPMPLSHLGSSGAVPKKCVLCPNLFEGECSRIAGRYNQLDHGPCRVETKKLSLVEMKIDSKSFRLPFKCQDCKNLMWDKDRFFYCREDQHIWGDFPRELDFYGLEDKIPSLPVPLMKMNSGSGEGKNALLDAFNQATLNLSAEAKNVSMVIEGDIGVLRLGDLEETINRLQNLLPDRCDMQYSTYEIPEMKGEINVYLVQVF
ncbi:MAG: hypothetical protein JXL67_08450 [Calditrichaeota bacterium]|nr:hypothetical protein [Calditrichota bacterium]